MLKKTSTTFLKLVLLLIAITVLFGMLRFPPSEGAAQGKDLISIYTDPFIIYIYIGSIPFFTGLYQAYKLLGYIEQNKTFSKNAVNALRGMKYSALALIGFIVPALLLIFIMSKTTTEDGAGPIALGLIVIFATSIVAAASGLFQNLLQKRIRK